MALAGNAVVTKVPDGDVSFGNKNGELFTLSDVPSDYPTGGYPFIGGEAVSNNPALASTQNIDLWRIDTIQDWGDYGGYTPKWNPVTQKLQMWTGPSGAGPDIEVAAGTDLSGVVYLLCAIGS